MHLLNRLNSFKTLQRWSSQRTVYYPPVLLFIFEIPSRIISRTSQFLKYTNAQRWRRLCCNLWWPTRRNQSWAFLFKEISTFHHLKWNVYYSKVSSSTFFLQHVSSNGTSDAFSSTYRRRSKLLTSINLVIHQLSFLSFNLFLFMFVVLLWITHLI